MSLGTVIERGATSAGGPQAVWARERRMGGRVPWVWCFWKRGRAGCSRVGGSGWLWPPRMARGEYRADRVVGLVRLMASLARTRVTSARARIARFDLEARLRAVGCVCGRRAVVFQLRGCCVPPKKD